MPADKDRPTVVLSTTAGLTNTKPVPVIATFSEPVFGFTASGISRISGADSVVNFVAVSDSVYTFALTPTGSVATIVLRIAEGAAKDAANNINYASTDLTISFGALLLFV